MFAIALPDISVGFFVIKFQGKQSRCAGRVAATLCQLNRATSANQRLVRIRLTAPLQSCEKSTPPILRTNCRIIKSAVL
jgi:hypothetical protein